MSHTVTLRWRRSPIAQASHRARPERFRRNWPSGTEVVPLVVEVEAPVPARCLPAGRCRAVRQELARKETHHRDRRLADAEGPDDAHVEAFEKDLSGA